MTGERTEDPDASQVRVPEMPMSRAQAMLLDPLEEAEKLSETIADVFAERLPGGARSKDNTERYTREVWKEYSPLYDDKSGKLIRDGVNILAKPSPEKARSAAFFPLYCLTMQPETFFPPEVVKKNERTFENMEMIGPDYLRSLFALASGKSPNFRLGEKTVAEHFYQGSKWISAMIGLTEKSARHCKKNREDRRKYQQTADDILQFMGMMHDFDSSLSVSVSAFSRPLDAPLKPLRP